MRELRGLDEAFPEVFFEPPFLGEASMDDLVSPFWEHSCHLVTKVSIVHSKHKVQRKDVELLEHLKGVLSIFHIFTQALDHCIDCGGLRIMVDPSERVCDIVLIQDLFGEERRKVPTV